MKKLFLVSAILLSLAASAQSSVGYYGLHNAKTGFRQGWGGGMDGLSSPLFKSFPIKLQLGAGYSLLGDGQKQFRDVSLIDGASPVDVTFSNMQHTIQGIFRVSVPSPNERLAPYAEFTPGVRINTSSVSVYDDSDHTNCNTYNPGGSVGLNLGAGAGLLVNLNKIFTLDVGMTWSKTQNPGNRIVMNSVNVNDGIYYGMKQAPSTVTSFRIGIRFNISNDGCCSVEGCSIPQHHKSCGGEHIR